MISRPSVPPLLVRLAHLFALLVVLAAVLPFVVYAVPGLVGAEDSFVVLSGSMEPAFGAGDGILIERVDPSTLQPGDVIAFRNGESEIPTVHRVTERVQLEGGTVFQTKGDANESPDQRTVRPEQVLGRVPTAGGHLFVLPLIGHVILFIGTPVGFATLVVAPLGLLIAGELRSLLRAGRAAPDRDDGDDPGAGSGGDRSTGRETTRTVSLDRDSLVLALPVLGAFAVYAGWTALQLRSGLSIAVAVASGVSFLLGIALLLTARWSGAGPAPLPAVPIDPVRIEAHSIPALLALAAERDSTLRWDPSRSELSTGDESMVFVTRLDRPTRSELVSQRSIGIDQDTLPTAETDGGDAWRQPTGAEGSDDTEAGS